MSGFRILLSVLLGTLAGLITLMFGASAMAAVLVGAGVGSLVLCIIYLRSGANIPV